MKLYKKYVKVVALVDKEGNVSPLFIVWDNGTKYPIDKIIEIRKAHSMVGGGGILYRCRILEREYNLFYEINRWFIESRKP